VRADKSYRAGSPNILIIQTYPIENLMIIYKITIILDGDASRVITVSIASIITFLEAICHSFPQAGIESLITRLKQLDLDLDQKNNPTDNSSIGNAKSSRSHDQQTATSKKEESSTGTGIHHPTTTRSSNDDEVMSMKSYPSIVDELTDVLKLCGQDPDIITSDSFKQLMHSNPLPHDDTGLGGSSSSSSSATATAGQVPSITAIDLILQPLDYSLLYIPRAGRQYLDVELSSAQSLVWRFRVENDYDINFALFVYISSSTSASDDLTASSNSSFQGLVDPSHPSGSGPGVASEETSNSQRRGKQVMNKFMKKTNGLLTIDLSGSEEEFGNIRVLEPLTRIKGSAVSSSEQQQQRLQSSYITRDGYIEGHYHADIDVAAGGSRHLLRLIFDNSRMTGKYIDYIIQVVDADTMNAAKAAAEDYTLKLSQPRSMLYENITNSRSIDFLVDGPWIIKPTKLLAANDDGIAEDMKAAVMMDDYSDGHTMIPGWISALGSLPVAGSIVLSVTDKVAKMPLVSKFARTIDHFLPAPKSIETRIAESSTSDDVAISSPENSSDRMVGSPIGWKSYMYSDTADASTMTDPPPDPLMTVQATNHEAAAPAPTTADETAVAVMPVDDNEEEKEELTQPQQLMDVLVIQRQLDDTRSELEDYKVYCDTMRKRINRLQQDQLSQQRTIDLQSEEIKSMQSQHELHQQSYTRLYDSYTKIKAEKQLLKHELLTLQRLGLYISPSKAVDSTTLARAVRHKILEPQQLDEMMSQSETRTADNQLADEMMDEVSSKKLHCLAIYREQHRALHELLSADEHNETLLNMANDLNQMIRSLQDELSSALLHQPSRSSR
jgi:hypothetical protein